MLSYLMLHRTAPSEYAEQPNTTPGKRVMRSIKLTSDQAKRLKLKDGNNFVEFSVITKLQGRAKVSYTLDFIFEFFLC
jgi:phosphatidate phosphatase PAH1